MTPSARDWLDALRRQIPEITPAETPTDGAALVLDVRESEETSAGMIPGAVHLPRGFLELRIEAIEPDRTRQIICYCAGGTRSLLAAEALQRLGYTQVASLTGGFNRWKDEGLPLAGSDTLTPAQRRRYQRHLLLPEIGEAGQRQLLNARVLLLGAGGLGSPAALYLALAGVGTLGLVDHDVVDESNLQRQVLHTPGRVGQSKLASARQTLMSYAPELDLVEYEEHLDSSNVERIFAGWDVIVDGTDNFPTRYLVNDACVLLKLPCVHGSIYRFEGQVTVFDPSRGGPCYRCLYPEPPPPELSPSCAEAGVLGLLPGVIGLLQAIEAVKLVVGIGEPLIGRLLAYDALAGTFRELRQRPDPACRYCAPGAVFPGFVDYVQFCGGR